MSHLVVLVQMAGGAVSESSVGIGSGTCLRVAARLRASQYAVQTRELADWLEEMAIGYPLGWQLAYDPDPDSPAEVENFRAWIRPIRIGLAQSIQEEAWEYDRNTAQELLDLLLEGEKRVMVPSFAV